MRRIFSQGDYDGACFLYALANAYFAVTGRRPGCDAWDRGVRALAHAPDFLGGCIGTTAHYAVDPQGLSPAVAGMLEAFNAAGPPVQWECLPAVKEVGQVAPHIDLDGVVIFRYHGETAHVGVVDHWVCGVAVTPAPFRLHLACSYRRTLEDWTPGGRYLERFHPQTGRFYNNWLDHGHDCHIFAGSVFGIRRQEKKNLKTIC